MSVGFVEKHEVETGTGWCRIGGDGGGIRAH